MDMADAREEGLRQLSVYWLFLLQNCAAALLVLYSAALLDLYLQLKKTYGTWVLGFNFFISIFSSLVI